MRISQVVGYIQGYHYEDKYPRITVALVRNLSSQGCGEYHVRVKELQLADGDVFTLEE